MSYLLDTDIISAFNKKTIRRNAAWLVKTKATVSSAWFPSPKCGTAWIRRRNRIGKN